jgi:FkbM family methyltransferase
MVRSWLRSLLKRLRRRAAIRRLPNHDAVVGVFGMNMLVRNPRESRIGRSIFTTGLWEPDVTAFISSRVKPGTTVVDVGADIGYYTLLFAKLVGPNGKVVAFEPIPVARAYLERNIAVNELGGVRVCGLALADRTGTVTLEEPLIKSSINLDKAPGPHDIQVEMAIFDDWWEASQEGPPHTIKMDVEGAEFMVLRGMERTLRAHHPNLVIELHPGPSAPSVMAFLEGLNYRPIPIDRAKIAFDHRTMIYFE